MNTPPKYEELVLKVAELDRREDALREELESIKASVDGYDSPEHAAQVADEMGYQCIALQQRLTVAEQRAADLKKLLCDVINEAPTGFASLKVDLAHRVNDALNPAAGSRCY